MTQTQTKVAPRYEIIAILVFYSMNAVKIN